jgi:hypothetical protein
MEKKYIMTTDWEIDEFTAGQICQDFSATAEYGSSFVTLYMTVDQSESSDDERTKFFHGKKRIRRSQIIWK